MIRSFPAQLGRARLARSAVLALAIELLMAGGLVAWLAQPSPVARRVPPPMEIALAAPDLPKPTPPSAPKPAAPKPPKPAAPVHRASAPPHAVPTRPAPPPPSAAPTQAVPPAPPASPASTPEPATPPKQPDAPAAPATPHADPSFEGALRGAIQAALHYPESARLAQMSGRARVAFHYRDGAATDVRLVTSSGVGLLDRAALAAVRDASYPKPPAAFAGQTLAEQLWVTFNLDDTP